MKSLQNLIITSLAFLLATGCQKSIGDDDAASAGGTTPTITDEQKAGALTIRQALEQASGTVCVKAFIVAATERSMSNVQYVTPFSASTAIVLAQRQSNGTAKQFDSNELLPVCLTDCSKAIRSAFNLQDHPEYQNKYVYVTGTLEKYLGQTGLKNVKAIEIDDSHVVTDDEKPDAVTGNGGDGDDDSNGEGETGGENAGGGDDEGSGTGEGGGTGEGSGTGEDTNRTLSIAEAKEAAEGTAISVKGYIVAALTGDTEHISFSYPDFNGYKTAIVLADSPYEASHPFDTKGYADLFIVYLGDCKPAKLKNELNLAEHPENHNRQVVITGKKGFYYGTRLLLQVTGYDWGTAP